MSSSSTGSSAPPGCWNRAPGSRCRTSRRGARTGEHWAQLLVDLAQYGWFLREGPFPLPQPLRYECIELVGLASRRLRRQAVVVVSGVGGQRWVTRVALPPPPTLDLTAAPLTIREWISEGSGHDVGNGSTAKQLGG